jgi:ABC-2 type transport system ATP-binding protein
VHRPEILLLDEPTFGVDPISRRDLWLILHEMVTQGTTVVVSTAYMDEAERCDRVALLHEGRLVALAPPLDLQQRLSGRVLEVRSSPARHAAELLRGLPDVREAAPFGETVHVVVDRGMEEWPRLREALREAGLAAEDAAPVEPSLEDVFLLITRETAASDA